MDSVVPLRMRPGRAWTVATVWTSAWTLASAAALAAQQEEPVLLSLEADLADFGLESPEQVRHGRVALVHDPEGPRIALHFLRSEPPAVLPSPVSRPLVGPGEGGDGTPEIAALWVWNTAEILAREAEREAFLDFVEREGIGRVFLYVPVAEGDVPVAGYLPFDGDALAPLLAQLRARGAVAYALDGDPEYARPENHEGVIRTVRRVAEHNRTHPPEQRFYGVRYDVEPYLLPGFQGPRRKEILGDYVRLLESVREVAHEAGLKVGADIPFWFDAGDEVTGEPFEVDIGGSGGPVLQRVMRTVDDVAIMAYRTTAEGPNGVLQHTLREIELGNEGGAQVFVGVETTRLHDEDLYTLRSGGRAGLPPLPDARWIVLETLDGPRVRVWLVEGAGALDELARVADPRALRSWFAGQPVALPGSLLSFHSLGAPAMRAVTARIERQYARQPGFLGLAFHDYRGLKALLEGR